MSATWYCYECNADHLGNCPLDDPRERAMREEREACARLCESRSESLMSAGQYVAANEANKCAMAIRTRMSGSALEAA